MSYTDLQKAINLCTSLQEAVEEYSPEKNQQFIQKYKPNYESKTLDENNVNYYKKENILIDGYFRENFASHCQYNIVQNIKDIYVLCTKMIDNSHFSWIIQIKQLQNLISSAKETNTLSQFPSPNAINNKHHELRSEIFSVLGINYVLILKLKMVQSSINGSFSPFTNDYFHLQLETINTKDDTNVKVIAHCNLYCEELQLKSIFWLKNLYEPLLMDAKNILQLQNTVTLSCKINTLSIKYIDTNNETLNVTETYCDDSVNMQTISRLKWKLRDNMPQLQFNISRDYKTGYYSDSFDNNNWCIIMEDHDSELSFTLDLLQFPPKLLSICVLFKCTISKNDHIYTKQLTHKFSCENFEYSNAIAHRNTNNFAELYFTKQTLVDESEIFSFIGVTVDVTVTISAFDGPSTCIVPCKMYNTISLTSRAKQLLISGYLRSECNSLFIIPIDVIRLCVSILDDSTFTWIIKGIELKELVNSPSDTDVNDIIVTEIKSPPFMVQNHPYYLEADKKNNLIKIEIIPKEFNHIMSLNTLYCYETKNKHIFWGTRDHRCLLMKLDDCKHLNSLTISCRMELDNVITSSNMIPEYTKIKWKLNDNIKPSNLEYSHKHGDIKPQTEIYFHENAIYHNVWNLSISKRPGNITLNRSGFTWNSNNQWNPKPVNNNNNAFSWGQPVGGSWSAFPLYKVNTMDGLRVDLMLKTSFASTMFMYIHFECKLCTNDYEGTSHIKTVDKYFSAADQQCYFEYSNTELATVFMNDNTLKLCNVLVQADVKILQVFDNDYIVFKSNWISHGILPTSSRHSSFSTTSSFEKGVFSWNIKRDDLNHMVNIPITLTDSNNKTAPKTRRVQSKSFKVHDIEYQLILHIINDLFFAVKLQRLEPKRNAIISQNVIACVETGNEIRFSAAEDYPVYQSQNNTTFVFGNTKNNEFEDYTNHLSVSVSEIQRFESLSVVCTVHMLRNESIADNHMTYCDK
eukprot:481595_1